MGMRGFESQVFQGQDGLGQDGSYGDGPGRGPVLFWKGGRWPVRTQGRALLPLAASGSAPQTPEKAVERAPAAAPAQPVEAPMKAGNAPKPADAPENLSVPVEFAGRVPVPRPAPVSAGPASLAPDADGHGPALVRRRREGSLRKPEAARPQAHRRHPWLRRLAAAFFILLAAAILWFFRPWWHDGWMFLYTRPVFLEAAGVWLLLHLILRRLARPAQASGDKRGIAPSRRPAPWLWPLSVGLLAFLLWLGALAAGWAQELYLARTVPYLEASVAPTLGPVLPGIPAQTAYDQARKTLPYSQYRLGRPGFSLVEGRIGWGFPLVPNGWIPMFLWRSHGVVVLEGGPAPAAPRALVRPLAVGEGMQLTDNLWWRLWLRYPLYTAARPLYIPTFSNGSRVTDLLTVVPLVGYSFHWWSGIPFTIPRFAGVAVLHADGREQFLSAAQVQRDPVLSQAPVFPVSLARLYASAYSYRDGLVNVLFLHRNQLQIVGRPASQPLDEGNLRAAAGGLAWVFGAKPYGESQAVVKLFVVDACAGWVAVAQAGP